MKNIKIILLLVTAFVFMSGTSQSPINEPYIGTWEYQQGNQIFRLVVWEDSTPIGGRYYLNGRYEMVQVDGGTENVIYMSNPAMFDGSSLPSCFSGSVSQQINGTNRFGGDFTQMHEGGGNVRGTFTMSSVAVCETCSPKVHWNVTQSTGVRIVSGDQTGQVTTIIIPNDIDLVKVQ